jgi:hypothetical protein
MSIMSLESINRLGRGALHRNRYGRDRLRDLAREVKMLRKQVKNLAGTARRTGALSLASAGTAAYGLRRFARDNGPMAMEQFGRQAGRAGHSMRRHPLPMVATLGLITLIAYMFLRRD